VNRSISSNPSQVKKAVCLASRMSWSLDHQGELTVSLWPGSDVAGPSISRYSLSQRSIWTIRHFPLKAQRGRASRWASKSLGQSDKIVGRQPKDEGGLRLCQPGILSCRQAADGLSPAKISSIRLRQHWLWRSPDAG